MTNNFSSISDILNTNSPLLSQLPTDSQHNHDDTTEHVDSEIQDTYKNPNNLAIQTESQLSPTAIASLHTSLQIIKEHITLVEQILNGQLPSRNYSTPPRTSIHNQIADTSGNIIEGVFDGQAMIGPDGQTYPIPPNYASKSKLVEGDLMKLTVTNQGAFIFKQIAPTPRKRVIGEAIFDQSLNQWHIAIGNRMYKILTASATFYRINPGDETAILIPEDGESSWGAVDNVMHN